MAYNPQSCIECNKQTVSVISTPEGPMCYNCYAEKKKPSRKKKHDKPEERMQIEFFNQVPIFFPKLPGKILFAVPNGGSRNIIEAKNLKAQGVKSGLLLSRWPFQFSVRYLLSTVKLFTISSSVNALSYTM